MQHLKNIECEPQLLIVFISVCIWSQCVQINGQYALKCWLVLVKQSEYWSWGSVKNSGMASGSEAVRPSQPQWAQGDQSVDAVKTCAVLHASAMSSPRPGWNPASPGEVSSKGSHCPDGGRWLLLAPNVQTSSLQSGHSACKRADPHPLDPLAGAGETPLHCSCSQDIPGAFIPTEAPA